MRTLLRDALGVTLEPASQVLEVRECNLAATRCRDESALWKGIRGTALWLERVTRPGARIALQFENSATAFILYWAVLLSGRTVVNLSPELPELETQSRLALVEPELLIQECPIGGQTELSVKDIQGKDLSASDLKDALDCEVSLPSSSLPPLPSPSSLASIVFTSGTTGELKAVALTRANLAWACRAIARSFPGLGRSGAEVYSGFLPFSHSYGQSVTWLAVVTGGRLVTTDRVLSGQGMVALLEEQRVTHLSLVPFQVKFLLKTTKFSHQKLPWLRRITVAGGGLDLTSTEALCHRFPDRVVTMYGLTEASPRVTCMPPGELFSHPRSSGLPLEDVEVRLGEQDEILVRGPNVMAGYFRDPEATSRTLRDGWLHTGDQGRLDSQGYLSVMGRLKDVIKVAGVSLSAPGLEECLGKLPGIETVAVVGVPDQELGERIRVFLVGTRHPIAAIRKHCRVHLGPHYVPWRVDYRDALPLTPSGKVDKAKLKAEGS